MRIATWNAARGKAEKKVPILKSKLEPDIAAIQEIAKPAKTSQAFFWQGKNKNIGVMLCAEEPYRLRPASRFKVKTELYQAAGVFLGRRKLFNVVNFWVKPPKQWPREECSCPYGYSLTKAIDCVFECFRSQTNVVMGDFNIVNPMSKDYYRKRLSDLGLVSAYHGFSSEDSGQESSPTHFHRTSKTTHHIDWCFIPKSWMKHVRSVKVGKLRSWKGISDHFPIVVDIDDAAIE